MTRPEQQAEILLRFRDKQIEERESRHAFWGMDPSGHCTCDDCNAPDGDES